MVLTTDFNRTFRSYKIDTNLIKKKISYRLGIDNYYFTHDRIIRDNSLSNIFSRKLGVICATYNDWFIISFVWTPTCFYTTKENR